MSNEAVIKMTKTLFIKNVNVVRPDLENERALIPSTSVFISNGKIAAIGELSREKEAEIVIDATGKWLIPGLIDTHVHFFQSGNPYTRPDAIDLTKKVQYRDEVERNKARLAVTLRTWLASGVTTVMDMGGPFWNFYVKEEASKLEKSPGVLVTGPLFSMVADPPLELDDPPIIKVASKEDVDALAVQILENKPDYLKVWFIHRPDDDISKQEEIVREVARYAHDSGIRLAVHATELDTAKAALRSGADILVHSVADTVIDSEFIQLAKSRNVVYIPTLYVPRGYREVFSRNWSPTPEEARLGDPEILAHMQDLEKFTESEVPERHRELFRSKGSPATAQQTVNWENAETNLLLVWNAGITVALGTDAGNIGTIHGPSVFREMSLMAHAGLTPIQILRSATANGAIAAGKQGKLGKIEVDCIADLVLLNSNPLQNIDNASDIAYVIREGRLFSHDELAPGS